MKSPCSVEGCGRTSWARSLCSKGGEHSRENAQASHLHCNVRKSDRLIGVTA